MKRLFSLLLIFSLVFGLLGCNQNGPQRPIGGGLDSGETTPTDPDEDTAKAVTLVYDPLDSMNPFLSGGYTNRALFSLIYQGLFTIDDDYQPHPMLCHSYNVSADRKTYTFYLSQALFSDGTPITPADVTASLTAAQSSAWYGGRMLHVTSIRSYGDAVVVELDTPMENFPLLLDIPIVKATEIKADAPLGTGPYRLAEGQLKRQSAWWCEATLPVNTDTISLLAFESAAQIRDAFEFSGVSLVCTDPAGLDYVDYHNDYELWSCENGLFLYLVCNENSEVIKKSPIRTALSYAIDRETLVNTYYDGFAAAASLPASPASPWYNQALANKYSYNPEKFKQAVEEANLDGITLRFLVNTSDPLRLRIANAIATALRSYGLDIFIVEATNDTFVSLLNKGEYDFYLAQTRLPKNMDLSAFFGTDTSLNYGGLADPSAYAITMEALADQANFYTLHELIMEEGLICPILFQSYALYVQRGALSGFSPARDAIFYYDLGRTMLDALNKT